MFPAFYEHFETHNESGEARFPAFTPELELARGLKGYHAWHARLEPDQREAYDNADRELGRLVRMSQHRQNVIGRKGVGSSLTKAIQTAYRLKEAIAHTLGRP